MPELCLNVLCPAALQEKLLDALLMHPQLAVFTSTSTAAHGLAAGELSADEQVLGSAAAILVQVPMLESEREALLDSLRRQLAGARLRYWVTPVIGAGEIA